MSSSSPTSNNRFPLGSRHVAFITPLPGVVRRVQEEQVFMEDPPDGDMTSITYTLSPRTSPLSVTRL